MVVYELHKFTEEIKDFAENKNSRYKMIISYNSGENSMTMPLIQNDLEIQQSQDNQIYNGLTMPLTMLGNTELRTINISTVLPCRRYSWMDADSIANPDSYIEFFQYIMNNKIPARIQLFRNDKSILNMPVCINAMNYSIEKCGDYLLALNLQEYKLVSIKKSGAEK